MTHQSNHERHSADSHNRSKLLEDDQTRAKALDRQLSMEQPMLRPVEVAEMLQIEESTLRKWEQRGVFPPAYRIGRRTLRWLRSDVIDYLNDNDPQTEGY